MFRFALLLLVATAFAQDKPTPKEVADTFFNAIDADGDGKFVRADVDTYFNKYDTDSDNEVSLKEFEDYVTAAEPTLSDYVDDAYKVFDTNSDGNLDGADFDAAFTSGDNNSDGDVTKAEFDGLFIPIFEAIEAAGGGN